MEADGGGDVGPKRILGCFDLDVTAATGTTQQNISSQCLRGNDTPKRKIPKAGLCAGPGDLGGDAGLEVGTIASHLCAC